MFVDLLHNDLTYDKAKRRTSSAQRADGETEETDIERKIREIFKDTVRTPKTERQNPRNASQKTIGHLARLSLALALRRLHVGKKEDVDRVIAERRSEANRSRRVDARRHMVTLGRNVMSAARARNMRHLFALLRPYTPRGKKMSRRQTLTRHQRKEINAFFEILYKKKALRERAEWTTPGCTPRPEIRQDPWANWYINARVQGDTTTLTAVRADATSDADKNRWTELRRFDDEGRTLPEALARAALWAIQNTQIDRRVRIYCPAGKMTNNFENIVTLKADNFAKCESPKVWRQIYTEQIRRGIEFKTCDDKELAGVKRAQMLLSVRERPQTTTEIETTVHWEHGVVHWLGSADGPVIDEPDVTRYAGEDGPPTEAEVRMAVRRLRRFAAAGADGVTTDQVQQVDIATLTDILREVWLSGKVPKIWKCGILVLIPKTTKPAQGKNMRGITLTSQVSKIMTGIIQQRNAACGLSDELFGFRAGRGVDAPILLVKKAIRDAVRKGEQRFLLFVDLHKAYDYLDRDLTWEFLRKYGMGLNTLNILQSLYEDELLLDLRSR